MYNTFPTYYYYIACIITYMNYDNKNYTYKDMIQYIIFLLLYTFLHLIKVCMNINV